MPRKKKQQNEPEVDNLENAEETDAQTPEGDEEGADTSQYDPFAEKSSESEDDGFVRLQQGEWDALNEKLTKLEQMHESDRSMVGKQASEIGELRGKLAAFESDAFQQRTRQEEELDDDILDPDVAKVVDQLVERKIKQSIGDEKYVTHDALLNLISRAGAQKRLQEFGLSEEEAARTLEDAAAKNIPVGDMLQLVERVAGGNQSRAAKPSVNDFNPNKKSSTASRVPRGPGDSSDENAAKWQWFTAPERTAEELTAFGLKYPELRQNFLQRLAQQAGAG